METLLLSLAALLTVALGLILFLEWMNDFR